jgi:iron complex transport system substrate-binding protein
VPDSRLVDPLRPDALKGLRSSACARSGNVAGPRILVILIGATLVALLASACAPDPENPAGHVDGIAQRIVTLAPHITELAYAAGAGELLVATVEYSDFPAAATALPRVGDAFRVDFERLAMLEPDLLLVWASGTPAETVSKLRELNYRVVALDSASLEDVAADIVAIGELAGTSDIAEPAAAALRQDIARLRTDYSASQQQRVFFQISNEPLFTVTGAHIISDVIELCGGQNIFHDLSGLAPPVTLEAVIAADPDVVIAAVSAGAEGWQDAWLRWDSMQAVRNSNLYGVNRDLISRPGPRIVAAAQEVCNALGIAAGN